MISFRRPFGRGAAVALALVAVLVWHGGAHAAQLTLTWTDNSSDEVGFAVERSTGTSGTFGEIGDTDAGVTTYVDSTVADGVTYCYRVRAFSATAYSNYSGPACAAVAQALGLTVVKMGAGTGSVTSSPSGILCGATCSGTFPGGSAVTLSAAPAAGSAFTGWSGGGCTGSGSCTVTVTSTTTVAATFEPASVSLTVGKSGTGSGSVSSAPAGIACGTTCTASYPYGTSVSLAAAPGTGSTFTGWSGACSGTGGCTVSLTSATAVAATFIQSESQPATLTVATSGKGTVTSAPGGIDCGKTCSAGYPAGTSVTLTATPAPGFSFLGWSGNCTGTGSCAVTMTGDRSVTATFRNTRSK